MARFLRLPCSQNFHNVGSLCTCQHIHNPQQYVCHPVCIPVWQLLGAGEKKWSVPVRLQSRSHKQLQNMFHFSWPCKSVLDYIIQFANSILKSKNNIQLQKNVWVDCSFLAWSLHSLSKHYVLSFIRWRPHTL